MRTVLKRCLSGFLVLFPALLNAHALGTSLLQLAEQPGGEYLVRWVPADELEQLPRTVEPVFPVHCRYQPPLLNCGQTGLQGELALAHLPPHAEVIVQIQPWRGDGHTEVLLDSGTTVSLKSNGLIPAGGDAAALLRSYAMLGIEHILLGIDHLLFVLGLILLVGFGRKIIWTITAFTVAHSFTLALSVLGTVTLPSTAVETVIALSIVLVASESLRSRQTLSRRMPHLIAFIFGLVHGLGFADALKEIGFGSSRFALTVLSFNIGVEAGQLMFIGILYAVSRLAQRFGPRPSRITARYAAYAVGAVAVYWMLERFQGVVAWPS